jgi:hypothetical protein
MGFFWGISQAHAIIAEVTKSTGTNSMLQSSLYRITLSNPKEKNAVKPKAAKESTQFSTGSLYEEVTETFVISA